MIVHFIKSIIRSLKNNRLFAFINVLGMSIALASAFFITIYVLNETSYDGHHINRNRIYRVITHYIDFGHTAPGTPSFFADLIKEEIPGVERAVAVSRVRNMSFQMSEEWINESAAYAANEEIFDVFSFDFENGKTGKLLNDKYSTAISRSLSEKLFPGESAIGKLLLTRINQQEITFTIDAVFEDFPEFSTFHPKVFVHLDWIVESWAKKYPDEKFHNSWALSYYATYLLLDPWASFEETNQKVKALANEHAGEMYKIEVYLQNMADFYLDSSHLVNNSLSSGSRESVMLFMSIGLLILLIASVNYIILSSARTGSRFKEIGMRRVVGAGKMSIKLQVLTESIFYTFISFVFALIIVELLLPEIHSLFRQELKFNVFEDWNYVLVFFGFSILIGLIAGMVVSGYYASITPVDVFRNRLVSGKGKKLVRKVLITVQLVIFIGLLTSTLMINRQVDYVLKKDPGFNGENLLIVYLNPNSRKQYKVLKARLSSNPYVESISGGVFLPPTSNLMSMKFPHPDKPDEQIIIEGMSVDFNFIETMQMKLGEGRDFNPEMATDSSKAFILNKEAVSHFQIENPIGKEFGGRKIIGIIDDFNLHSMHSPIEPVAINIMNLKYASELIMRYTPGHLNDLQAFIDETWCELLPEETPNYRTFNNALKGIYSDERHLVQILTTFTALAIFISVMGLFGLSIFVAQSRRKEIAIRKVHGASVSNIFKMISAEFMILVLKSCAISFVFTYFIIEKWLENFAYSAGFSIWVFLLSGAIAATCMQLIISVKAYTASRSNPLDSIKYE